MIDTYLEKITKTVEFFFDQIQNIRSGSVTPAVLDSVHVDNYGQKTLLKHVAHTSLLNINLISVKPFDTNNVASIAKDLAAYNFNAYVFSKDTVCVSIPPISGDEKNKIRKHIAKLGEETKVAVRNIRKSAKTHIKNEINKEDLEKEIQEQTDMAVNQIEKAVREKVAKI